MIQFRDLLMQQNNGEVHNIWIDTLYSDCFHNIIDLTHWKQVQHFMFIMRLSCKIWLIILSVDKENVRNDAEFVHASGVWTDIIYIKWLYLYLIVFNQINDSNWKYNTVPWKFCHQISMVCNCFNLNLWNIPQVAHSTEQSRVSGCTVPMVPWLLSLMALLTM